MDNKKISPGGSFLKPQVRPVLFWEVQDLGFLVIRQEKTRNLIRGKKTLKVPARHLTVKDSKRTSPPTEKQDQPAGLMPEQRSYFTGEAPLCSSGKTKPA